MFYQDNVQDTRQFFYSSWEKYRNKLILTPLETQIVDVIIDHPEYHLMLETVPTEKDKANLPEMGETHPFLHMGLHLAIRDQIATDRPAGIKSIYQQLTKKNADSLTAEHLIMERFAECLWQAQQNKTMPDELAFLSACQKLVV